MKTTQGPELTRRGNKKRFPDSAVRVFDYLQRSTVSYLQEMTDTWETPNFYPSHVASFGVVLNLISLPALVEISRLLESGPFNLQMPESNPHHHYSSTNMGYHPAPRPMPYIVQTVNSMPEKPYACSHCTKTFSNRNNLKYHMSTHLGGKPYKCKNCEYRTAYPSGIYQHNKVCPGKRLEQRFRWLREWDWWGIPNLPRAGWVFVGMCFFFRSDGTPRKYFSRGSDFSVQCKKLGGEKERRRRRAIIRKYCVRHYRLRLDGTLCQNIYFS